MRKLGQLLEIRVGDPGGGQVNLDDVAGPIAGHAAALLKNPVGVGGTEGDCQKKTRRESHDLAPPPVRQGRVPVPDDFTIGMRGLEFLVVLLPDLRVVKIEVLETWEALENGHAAVGETIPVVSSGKPSTSRARRR